VSEPIVRVEGLGKCYRLRHSADGDGPRYTTLRDVLAAKARAPFRRLAGRPPAAPTREDFWALHDVSFEVPRGEVVGIIGRNGAGKSTLLKILSRITEPTRGRVTLGGRVASLLEVGTGFHPELSGRENIYLNGAILGMSRQEIARKFDEIVAFAEVERFLDTPVKHYSSGMYVRLAFGVAAHLEPDVLIVDEVLAVGDAEFQKKSLGKMRAVSSGGRTVLFVSHNMGAIQALCSRAIWLNGGAVAFDGAVGESISRYLTRAVGQAGVASNRAVRVGSGLELRQFQFTPNPVPGGEDVRFLIECHATDVTRVSELAMLILSSQETRLAIVDLRDGLPVTLAPGRSLMISGVIRQLPLVEGDYRIGLYAVAGNFSGDLADLAELRVLAPAPRGGTAPYSAMYRGFVELDVRIDALQSS
jgi:lipopolysaccharide transport system ATP-binding protein